MQNLKNIVVGFLISFVGSIPLGYLNVVGFDIYSKQGLKPTFLYLLGVVFIEFFVIFFTLLLAKKLANNKKLIKYIEGFSILFMFLLSYIFYSSASSQSSNETVLDQYLAYSPIVIGLILSCLNFIQIPFWTSWNLYLLNGKYIEISNNRKYFYVVGTIIGTFSGMLFLILTLHFFTLQNDFLSKYLLKIIIPLVFSGLGIFQAMKFYKKYYK